MPDAVDRLTPLGLMLLALLHEDDMHAYEMVRLLRERKADRLVAPTHGTIYHTVARLERQGLIAEVGTDRDGNRPERTTYTLTEAGADMMIAWVRRELPAIDRPDRFRVALAESHNLDRGEVVALLSERRDALAASLGAHRQARDHAIERGSYPQFWIEVHRETALLSADVAWLDEAVEYIRRPDTVWGVTDLAPTDRYLAQREAARA
ncbi:putative transcriptional regulator [Microbacterium sp. TS-1]|uniref:PadR family transcriptional regulator n=1 Tax=unclassified Microbacterium TaxID=2609290 RepID=UPI00038FDC5E|nr:MULTISPECIES: PadR family transcriptional regulator [unclassified Microbacterium]POX68198.1 PadR family transcriptional regulator [Microbacterium sp. Ru50]QCR39141.1 PadR family transcriptional regulator [Microbacterium sp. SGAir0570]GAD34354.1 putative transcriptional regulator [Microbacterium sp. TS-1]